MWSSSINNILDSLFVLYDTSQLDYRIAKSNKGNYPVLSFNDKFTASNWSPKYGAMSSNQVLDLANDLLKSFANTVQLDNTLDSCLQLNRGNQTAVADYLGVNRGTLRTAINTKNPTAYIVVNAKVYKYLNPVNE